VHTNLTPTNLYYIESKKTREEGERLLPLAATQKTAGTLSACSFSFGQPVISAVQY